MLVAKYPWGFHVNKGEAGVPYMYISNGKVELESYLHILPPACSYPLMWVQTPYLHCTHAQGTWGLGTP